MNFEIFRKKLNSKSYNIDQILLTLYRFYWVNTKACIISFLFFFTTMFGYATHNRAGEVIYCHINGLRYGITIITYTKASSCAADRCELEIKFGDGSIDTIPRINGSNCPPGCGSCGNCGEIVGDDTKKNIYYTEHTYSGIGTYLISVEDPTRNAGVQNIPNSVDVAFYIESELIIFPGGGNNCSPILNFPPIDNGCVGLKYEHNPGATDPDGDSLVFSLVDCKGFSGSQIPGFVQPNLTPGGCSFGTLEIDAQTGLLEWDYPQCQGEFNLAILIEEYRNGFKIGSVLRDMQITIISPCPNNPPDIVDLKPLCVMAGDTISKNIVATDLDTGQIVTLNASGEPLTLAIKPALFPGDQEPSPVSSTLYWETDCEHVKPSPYILNFKAADNHPQIPLVDYETMEISIISPAPELQSISSLGSTITVDWEESFCPNASCYKIYRKIDSLGYAPDSCETGVPAYTGYVLIDQISGINNHVYIDQDPSLVHGKTYCYIITSCFSNGAESQASEEICIELKNDVPLITHVSISQTDITSGRDTLRWIRPTELDTINFPGPYSYKIYHQNSFDTPTEEVYTSPLFNFLYQMDTFFIHNNINTSENPENYQISLFYNTNVSVGTSDEASSVFLQSTPTDNALNLAWQAFVPWNNYIYYIYKKDLAGLFTLIDSSIAPIYTDDSLINGQEYCYYVVSHGEYSLDSILKPLINFSQIHCNIPRDNIAPCAIDSLTILPNCESFNIQIDWNMPDTSCADDVVHYYIYRSPQEGEAYVLIDSTSSNDTQYLLIDSSSIAGCYYVTALDTFYNESNASDTICVDNCPYYALPNVFTPGKDGYNDLFGPFPYRYIDSIQVSIYNRWGNSVFKSNNPQILWDGKNQNTGKTLNSGVYFYTCEVFAKKYKGLEKINLKGHIQLIQEKKKVTGP